MRAGHAAPAATTVDELDAATRDDAVAALGHCCGATAWVNAMVARRPFGSVARLLQAAEECAAQLDDTDWLEAFGCHPRIGDREVLRQRMQGVGGWSGDEQAGAAAAQEEILDALQAGNLEYEQRFGFVFLICATGRTAPEMLVELQRRLGNDRDTEIRTAADEHREITRLRLKKLVTQ